jgi:hypothetical protein
MGIATFVPEIWSAQILQSLKKAQVFGGLVNRNYEGEIANMGDTVHINSVSRPTINSYTTNTNITVENLQTAERALVVGTADYFAFAVDDVDKRQSAGGLLEAAVIEAAYGLSDKFDKAIAAEYANVATANKVNSGTAVAVTTGDIAWTQLTKLKQKCDEANIPTEGRWCVMAPWYAALLMDTNKVVTNAGVPAVAAAAAINGFVGQLLGFSIYMSNNAVLVTGDDYATLAGTNAAITVAEQISAVEAYRLQAYIADAVRGLHLYGIKTVRPDGLAYLLASQT